MATYNVSQIGRIRQIVRLTEWIEDQFDYVQY